MGRNNKITLNFVSIVTLIVMLFLLSGSGYIINMVDTSKEKLEQHVEMQNRQNARKFLLYLNDKLSNDVANKELDINNDEDINRWATENMRTLKSDSTYNDFAVVKVGFDKENEEFLGNYIWSSLADGFPTKEDDVKTTFDIIVDQEKAREYFEGINNPLSLNSLISYSDIVKDNTITKEDIKKLKELDIIHYKNANEVQETLDNMYQGSITSNTDGYVWEKLDSKKYFVEWTTVPLEASMGINNEPKTSHGLINPNYKRVIIFATIDYDYIMKPYNDTFKQFDYIKDCVHITIIVLVVLAIFFMLYCTWLIYYNKLRK